MLIDGAGLKAICPSSCLPDCFPSSRSGLPNRPPASRLIWLLIWRRVDCHPATPKLISLCHYMTPLPPSPPDAHTCTHIHKYLHLSLSHLHGRGQEGGWVVRERKVSALKEFIILKCQSRSLGEQMKETRRRGWEEASNKERKGCLYLSGYWLSAKTSSWPAELAAIHCEQLNHHCLCIAITCCLWLYFNYENSTHTYITLRLQMVIW